MINSGLLAQLQRFIEPLQRRLRLMVARGTVTLTADITGHQTCQLSVLQGEICDLVERIQNFGLSSVPMPGSEAVVIFANGCRDHGVVLGVEDRRVRPKALLPGESVVYNAFGSKVYLKATGEIEITNASQGKITLDPTGAISLSGPVPASGSLSIGIDGKAEVQCLKAKIGSPAADVVGIISELITAITAATTATAIGPQPLINPNFAILQAKIDTLKV